jgi:hypothetical protein
MSDTGEIIISEAWGSNDYANLITIAAAAISSVLLVVFKSRCKTINLCCGMINCIRDPMEEGEENNNNNDNNNNNNNNNPPERGGEDIIPVNNRQ